MTQKTIQDIAVDAVHDIAGGSCCGMVCQVRAGLALEEIERLSADQGPAVTLTLTPDEVVMVVEAWDDAMEDDYLPFNIPPGCSCFSLAPDDECDYSHIADCPISRLGVKLGSAYSKVKQKQ